MAFGASLYTFGNPAKSAASFGLCPTSVGFATSARAECAFIG
jgi:hypothetical protein